MSEKQEQVAPADTKLLRQVTEGYAKLKAEIAKVIIGQDQIVRQLLSAIKEPDYSD